MFTAKVKFVKQNINEKLFLENIDTIQFSFPSDLNESLAKEFINMAEQMTSVRRIISNYPITNHCCALESSFHDCDYHSVFLQEFRSSLNKSIMIILIDDPGRHQNTSFHDDLNFNDIKSQKENVMFTLKHASIYSGEVNFGSISPAQVDVIEFDFGNVISENFVKQFLSLASQLTNITTIHVRSSNIDSLDNYRTFLEKFLLALPNKVNLNLKYAHLDFIELSENINIDVLTLPTPTELKVISPHLQPTTDIKLECKASVNTVKLNYNVRFVGQYKHIRVSLKINAKFEKDLLYEKSYYRINSSTTPKQFNWFNDRKN